jgi:hypothetical protein
MATATAISITNLTMSNTPNVDMDLKDNQHTDQENFNSFQITLNSVNNGAFFPQSQVSDRGFGLLGVIGGCLLLSIFLVFITCMRQRKLYKVRYLCVRRTNKYVSVYFQENLQNHRQHCVQRGNAYMTSVLMKNIQHDSSIEPPDYTTVLMREEQNLPTYLQALGQGKI